MKEKEGLEREEEEDKNWRGKKGYEDKTAGGEEVWGRQEHERMKG